MFQMSYGEASVGDERPTSPIKKRKRNLNRIDGLCKIYGFPTAFPP